MIRAHTVEQVRAAEEPLLKAGVPLMARASTGLAVATARRLPYVYGARVVLLVGKGNNGADALWAGAWLARRGSAVVAVLADTPVQDALEGFLRAGGRVGGRQGSLHAAGAACRELGYIPAQAVGRYAGAAGKYRCGRQQGNALLHGGAHGWLLGAWWRGCMGC